jgi:dCMP deaminase
MNLKHLTMYMEMARVAAKQSYANRLKVGALAVKDHRILSVGYNGTPSNRDNECEGADGKTKPDVIHAEMNLIYKMARDGQAAQGADLFITHSPCFECAKAILTVGFKKVWFGAEYRDSSGVDFLKHNGVEIEKLGN